MLKGGALLLVITISLIITLLITSLILFFYYQRTEIDINLLNMKLVRNANSGLQLLLSSNQLIQSNDSLSIDLYDRNEDSVKLKRSTYGLFEIHSVTAFHQNLSYTKSAMIGSSFSSTLESALYMVDKNKPLSVCGNTSLNGMCYLPEAGVKRAYIEGQSFIGVNLVNGDILKSNKSLPTVNKFIMDQISGHFNGAGNANPEDSLTQWSEISEDSVFSSFALKTLKIYSSSSITISNKTLIGNIFLSAKDSIIVQSSANLENVILFAPKIIFEKNTTAALQAFASDTIIVNKNCHFKYPSILAVISNDIDMRSVLKIDSTSLIEGLVFSHSTDSIASSTTISIAPQAVVYGQVYSSGSLDLKGAVYGNVICDHFILKTSSSIYENHLLNAEIDANKIDPSFAFPLLLDDLKMDRTVQWLK